MSSSLTFYQAGEGWIHRLNPVTKLAFVVSVTVAAFGAEDLWWPAALFVLLEVPGALAAGVFGRFVKLVFGFFAPFLVILFLIQGLTFPDPGTVLAEFGPLAVKTEGLLFAGTTALRLLVMVGAFILLLLTTHPGTLMTAMSQAGLPPKIAYVVSATLQIIPAFQERANAILQAQQARGFDIGAGGALARGRRLIPLMGPLLLGALTEVENRSLAMESRAFGASVHPTAYTIVPDSTAQRAARWIMILLAIAAIVLNTLGVL
ncbi:energy-coupling factor transport system permease protein [Spinactinospora alkalitolerans]|uniref:Energy-coupling factor transport system permease protein n=1 Tax=Spinactinospora alkalitolerans TaxID=687207 RepID=A0A852TZC0_9ACTN|nr:energy-coupling factor transporter transmembrane component T [Spinactinospora alkalitolerans]NYE47314.1 energy-coupling factor transport system permease protein [Spinactinospora alkalitolerans]